MRYAGDKNLHVTLDIYGFILPCLRQILFVAKLSFSFPSLLDTSIYSKGEVLVCVAL